MAMTPYGWVNDPNYGQIQWEQDRANDAANEKRDRIQRYNDWLKASMGNAPIWGSQYAQSIGLNPTDPNIANIINMISGDIGA